MEITVVVAAIIKQDDKYLIAQRKKGTHLGLLWEFPGGKLEKGESPEECLQREIQEELSLKVEPMDIYKVVSHHYETKHIIMLCYFCRIISGVPQLIECNDFQWVTAKEMSSFQFAPADLPVVAALRETNINPAGA